MLQRILHCVRRPLLAVLAGAALFFSAKVAVAAPRQSSANSLQAINQQLVPAIDQSTSLGALNPLQTLNLTVSMPFRDPAGAQAYADAASNPHSYLYRHFIEPEDNAKMFGLSQNDRQAVRDYLEANNLKVTFVARTGLAFSVTGMVADIQAAFHTQINRYVSQVNKDQNGQPLNFFANASPIEVPAAIAPFVQYVSGLESFTRPERRSLFTPSQARTLYNLTAFWGAGMQGEGRTLGISNFDGYLLSNLPTFVSTFGLPTPAGGVGANITEVHISGGASTGPAQGEGDLDIQMVIGQAPLSSLYIYDGGNSDLIGTLAREASDNVCDVISESWGWGLSSSYADSSHSQHVAMTNQGMTYMAASGDDGTNWTARGFNEDYPDADPEVLMVGGTSAQINGSGVRQSEVGWDGSGSGYSTNNYSWGARPAWQVAQNVPSVTTYPKRIVPDVAGNASGSQTGSGTYYVRFAGAWYTFYGTSCSSPVFCGGLGVAEQKIIANGGLSPNYSGKRRFGRIQDLFYQQNNPNMNSSIWYDVTTGGNVGTLPGTSTSVSCGPGWDWATGLGCIDWNAFVASQNLATPIHGYTVTVIKTKEVANGPTFSSNGGALGVSEFYQVGYAGGFPGINDFHASLWSGSQDSYIDINPPGFTSSVATCVSGVNVVGYGSGPSTGNNIHALLFGSPANFVDLHPAGFTRSKANGVSGTTQVGYAAGPSTGSVAHAMRWSGSAASAFDLHPSGYDRSNALATSDKSIVGYVLGSPTAGYTHAFLWNGISGATSDLNPSGFDQSYAVGVSGSTQVGYGAGSATGGQNQFHALLWNGSAASAVDLNPVGFYQSQAMGVFGATQVGVGFSSTDHEGHALVWAGSASSYVDLHPPGFVSSYASAIASNGDIVGYGGDNNGNGFAILWRKTVAVSAAVTISGYVGDPTKIAGKVNIYPQGGTTLLASAPVSFAADGSASATVYSVPEGTYDITLKTTKTLGRRLSSVVISASGAVALQYSLNNGDIDNNNVVNINDYAILSDAFNISTGQTGFDDRADLDGNGIININDYSILSDNFNLVGDN